MLTWDALAVEVLVAQCGDAGRTIVARAGGTGIILLLTELTHKGFPTLTFEAVYPIHTLPSILTWGRQTFVDIGLTHLSWGLWEIPGHKK